MAFDKLKAMAEEAKSKAGDLGGAVLEKVSQSQHDLNESLPILIGLGLSVRNFRVEMALVPVVRLTLVGSVAAIEPDKVKALIDTHKEKKLLVAVLEALRTASLMKDQLGDLGFRGVCADVALSLPPSINVEFMKDAPQPG
jgi:hypothetical protein